MAFSLVVVEQKHLLPAVSRKAGISYITGVNDIILAILLIWLKFSFNLKCIQATVTSITYPYILY